MNGKVYVDIFKSYDSKWGKYGMLSWWMGPMSSTEYVIKTKLHVV